MNILVPVSWLREYLKTDTSAKKIAELLSLHGPSVERSQKIGEDYLFEVEVTTNRTDAASIYGLARETNTILNFNGQKSTLIEPKGTKTSLEPDLKEKLALDVSIAQSSLCPRFMAIILEGVKIKPSPAIIKNRLQTCGVRAINNIVDITNYVMLELGQPMHAFDFDKIKGAKMFLRQSQKGESVKTLDGQTRKLPQGTIVISDKERLIDLCGIMGGANSEISTRTKRVLLFVQAYDPLKIRKATQALAFRTEAAARFEKGVDIEKIGEALSEAVYLAKKTSGAKIASELIDIYKIPPPTKSITLSKTLLEDYLGIEFSLEKAAQILKSLGFTVKSEGDSLSAQAPSWRQEDTQTAVDLIEEIARIYGYHNLPSYLSAGSQPKESSESDLSRVISLKKALKYLELTETMSYSIISEEFLNLTGIKRADAVELSNPLSNEWQFMRPTLLISLASIIAQNQNMRNNLKLFEIAKTYLSAEVSTKADIPNNLQTQLPTQDLYLSLALQNSDFEKIKGYAENIFEILARDVEFKKLEENSPFLEKSQAAQIIIGNKVVGTLGILNNNVSNYFAIEGITAVAELNLSIIYQQSTINNLYRPIPKFPPVIEDISAIFSTQTPVAEIVSTVKSAGQPLLKQVEILDIYRDEKLGKDAKSITLHLTYQKPSTTPSQEEVHLVREKIIETLEKSLSAKVRKK